MLFRSRFALGTDSERKSPMPIRTIFVALALEDDSKRIADGAIQLAKQHKAQLVAGHVFESPPLHDGSLPLSIDLRAITGMLEDQYADQLQSLLGAADKSAVTQDRKSTRLNSSH